MFKCSHSHHLELSQTTSSKLLLSSVLCFVWIILFCLWPDLIFFKYKILCLSLTHRSDEFVQLKSIEEETVSDSIRRVCFFIEGKVVLWCNLNKNKYNRIWYCPLVWVFSFYLVTVETTWSISRIRCGSSRNFINVVPIVWSTRFNYIVLPNTCSWVVTELSLERLNGLLTPTSQIR